MACSITITSVFATVDTSGGAPASFTVSGVASDCLSIVVVVTLPSGASLGPVTASVGAQGGWSAELPIDQARTPLGCGRQPGSIIITATCSADASCKAEEKIANIICTSRDACPVFTGVTATPVDGASGCRADGLREVRFRGTMQPFGESAVVQFTVTPDTGGDPVNLGALAPQVGTPFESTVHLPDGTYDYALNVILPSPCTGPAGRVTVPPCGNTPPAPQLCPAILTASPVIGDCNAQGRRPVTVSATVNVVTGTSVTAALRITGPGTDIVLDQRSNQTTDFNLQGSATLAPGVYSVAVGVTTPSACNTSGLQFTVPACTPATDPGPGDDGPGNNPGDGGTGTPPPPAQPPQRPLQWCAIMMIIGLVLTILGGVVLGVAMCLVGIPGMPPQAVAIITVIAVIGFIIMIIGTLLLLVWLLICASCRRNCLLLDIVIEVLLFVMAIGFLLTILGGILSALGLTQVCWLGWLIATVDVGILYIIALYYARLVGCRPWPRSFPDWLRFEIPDVLRFACRD